MLAAIAGSTPMDLRFSEALPPWCVRQWMGCEGVYVLGVKPVCQLSRLLLYSRSLCV